MCLFSRNPRARSLSLSLPLSRRISSVLVRVTPNLQSLLIDDALQIEQRPKLDRYDHGVFLVVPMLRATVKPDPAATEDNQPHGQVRRRRSTGGPPDNRRSFSQQPDHDEEYGYFSARLL